MIFNVKIDKLFVLLILADLSFIFLHLLYRFTPWLPSNAFSIEKDLGYGEIFQYLKELSIVILFFFFTIKKWKFPYLIFSMLFLGFLVDDSLVVHERWGVFLSDFLHFQPGFGLRGQDFGELIFYLLFGAHFFVFLGIHYSRSDVQTRSVSKNMITLVVLLAFFGVVFDMIHITVEHSVINPILGIMDDGGEMLVMSTIAWYVYRLYTADE